MSFLGDIINGFFGNEAADKSADAQVDASKRANQTMLDMFNRSNQIQAPNQQAGWNALAMQGSLLGNPNMVPQGAIAGAMAATGAPGAQSVWQNYGAANPDVMQYFQNNPRALQQFGGDMDRALEHHYNTFGRSEGRELPQASAGGAPGGAPGGSQGSTGVGVGTDVDTAYNTFLDSGFGRSNLTTTGAEFENMVGAFGAGGNALSGSAIGALNDRNRRNTSGAFNNYYNALSGISGTGAQIGSQQAGAANTLGANVANNQVAMGQARGSSYLTQGANNAKMANSGVNAAAQFFGGLG
jgi:hypothetical protein